MKITNPVLTSSQIVIKVDYEPGYRGAASIPNFIEQKCGSGTFNLGDWSEIDGLRAYSGGAAYRKFVKITPADLKHKLVIDLGDLVSSAEVLINSKSAGIRVSPPWIYDITSLAKSGDNDVEILVYNTIANNYTSIPTMYLGSIKSGLVGPVKLKVIGE